MKTLSMNYAGLLNDPFEWCILERVYFACNLTSTRTWECCLSYLIENTPIKRRGTLISALNRLVERGFIISASYGKPIKLRGSEVLTQRFKYIASAEKIDELFEVLSKMTNSQTGPKPDQSVVLNRTSEWSASGPPVVLNRTSSGPKPDHIGDQRSTGKVSLIGESYKGEPGGQCKQEGKNSERLEVEIQSIKTQAIKFGWPNEFRDKQILELTKNFNK